MITKTNAHFEELKAVGDAYEEERKAHEEKKAKILEEHGWESEELKAWFDEKSKMTYPIPAGACKAYRAWQGSAEREADAVEMDDFLWENEVKDFVDTLRKAGIESFILTNTSTALMENLHQLTEEGCRMGELVKTCRKNLWGEGETHNGIRFTL